MNRKLLQYRNRSIVDEWNTTEATLDSLAKKYGGITREAIRIILKKEKAKGIFVLEAYGKTKKSLRIKSKYGDFISTVDQEVLDRYQNSDYKKWRDDHTVYKRKLITKTEKKLLREGKIIPRITDLSDRTQNIGKYKIIQNMKAKEYTLSQIGEALGLSVARITQLVKDMKVIGYELDRVAHQNQFKSISLTKKEIQRRDKLIMESMRTKTAMTEVAEKSGLNVYNLRSHKSRYITEKKYKDFLKSRI